MSIIVTGAAGFIGCNNTIALNKRGYTDILAVDNLTKADKFLNLSECQISDYMDKHDFIDLVRQGKMPRPEAVFHQGACSDTMATDGRYVMDNNYRYTLELYHWCQREKVPFIYASSAATYGASTTFVEDVKYEGPLNCYGYSKYLFDQVLRRDMARGAVVSPVTGFRYFNVYGPHEQHKGRMASVAFHQYFQFRKEGKVKLFEGCLGYGNGEQRRDFVYVGDVMDTILGFFDHPVIGILNLGTGRSQPFNDISLTVVNTLLAEEKKITKPLTLEEAVSQGYIEYIPFPEALKGKYQAFTQADLTNLRGAGCKTTFKTVEEGTALYMKDLLARYPNP